MKNIKDSLKMKKELIEIAKEEVKTGYLKTEKGPHAVTYLRKIGGGATLTSKVQRNGKGMEVLELRSNKQTIAYAQIFEDNQIQGIESIKNPSLRKIISEGGEIMAVGAGKVISETSNKIIVVNKNNKQNLIEITENHRKIHKELIEKFGGPDKIAKVIVSHKIMHDIKTRAERLLLYLANSKPNNRGEILIKHKEIYDQIIKLEKDSILEMDHDLHAIKIKIDSLVDEVSNNL